MKKLLALIFVLAISGLTWILPSPSPVVADDPAPDLSPVVIVTGEPEPEPVIEVTSEPAPEPEPEPKPEAVIEATPEPEPVVETVCYEDQECWNWETMGNRTSGVAITLYTGEVWTGNLTANGDGTYTFVRK